jgi:O-antigen biosynthesis protein
VPDVRAAAALARDVIVLVADLGRGPLERAAVEAGGRSDEVSVRYLAPAAIAGEDVFGGLLLLHLPGRARETLEHGTLVLRGERRLEIPGSDVAAARRDLGELLRRHLAPLSPPARNHVSHFLAGAAGFETGSADELSEALSQVRGGLREHLQRSEGWNDRRGAGVEKLLRIDPRTYFAYGWIGDRDADVVRVTAVSPEGERVEIGSELFRFARPDVWKLYGRRDHGSTGAGFICYLELQAPSQISRGWLLETENERGDTLEVEAPRVIDKREDVIAAVLEDPYHQRSQDDELMATHVVPAVTRLQEQVEAMTAIESVESFGDVPASPEVTVVVPLYRRIDLVEYQLAKFADDVDFRSTELLYVLDSPDQREDLLALCSGLASIYRVPFRVCVLQENVGFANACNAGAAIATGRLLVLLNSDVLPARQGWLHELRAFYDGTDDIGALGPKLLYEDDTIQDAGMYLHRPPGSSVWIDAHYFKCLHRSFPAANVPRPVPGLSGACLMLSRELYQQLGGLRGVYVRGDYEDFDLCLRLAQSGGQNWYLPAVELYHLEALSYEDEVRRHANRYNAWLHTHLWREQIESLAAGNGAPQDAAAVSTTTAVEQEL